MTCDDSLGEEVNMLQTKINQDKFENILLSFSLRPAMQLVLH